jgi:HTH-type transcriptional regulator / antitoxin HipB
MTSHTARLTTPADVGTALQQARMSLGMSQADLAGRVGVPQSTISQLENGHSTIYLRRLLAIARATGVELAATWSDDAPRR